MTCLLFQNCSCGLAEEQAAEGSNPAAASSVASSKPVSACGSVSQQRTHSTGSVENAMRRVNNRASPAYTHFSMFPRILSACAVRSGRCIPLLRLPVPRQAGLHDGAHGSRQAAAVRRGQLKQCNASLSLSRIVLLNSHTFAVHVSQLPPRSLSRQSALQMAESRVENN